MELLKKCTYTLIDDKLPHIKNYWGKKNKPEFWPKNIPFCSPSARVDDTKDGNEL